MKSKYVRETKAGKSVSAWVVLKRHKQIATVQAHYSDGGTTLVNVFNYGKSKSAETHPFQSATAGGYGYDKLTAALSGLVIDGHELTDHCGRNRKPEAGKLFPNTSNPPKGWQYSNFVWRDSHGEKLPADKQGYESCYRLPGLKYLEAIGYTVIQAI